MILHSSSLSSSSSSSSSSSTSSPLSSTSSSENKASEKSLEFYPCETEQQILVATRYIFDIARSLFARDPHKQKEFITIKLRILEQCAFIRDNYGSLLHWAIDYNRPEIVQILIAQGVDLTVRDRDGRTPLEQAIFSNRPEIVQLLEAATMKSADTKSADTKTRE